MTLSTLKPKYLKRYKDIAGLLLKHGRPDMMQLSGLDEAFLDEEMMQEEITEGQPEALVADLEALGPTFVKLGQLLSTRPDLLPYPYLEALARLQDKVEAFPYSEVEEIIWNELGLRVEQAFLEFDPEPIAAASLGQVHQARLRNGVVVAVKVQRPGIRQVVLEDLESFQEIATIVDKHTDIGRRYAFQEILEEFRKTLLRELDYRREAQSLIKLDQNLKRYRQIVVPQPVEEYTTSRLLTMEYIWGSKITLLTALEQFMLDGHALAEEVCKAYLDHILIDGFFHADPHPGNVFITEDGKLALIDLGMVAHVDSKMQDLLIRFVLAVSEGKGHETAELSINMGTRLDDADENRFTRQVSDLVARLQDATLEQLSIGRVVLELARVSAENGIRPAPELTIVGKTLLHLDEIGRILDPQFNPNEVVRQHADSIMSRHMLKSLAPGNIFSSILEMNEFVQELPRRVNTLLDALVNRDFEVKVDAFDETRLMNNLQKIANRITLGLVLAALIVGAALIMSIETPYTIFGYPSIAIILFLIAAGFGLALVINIFINDVWKRKN